MAVLNARLHADLATRRGLEILSVAPFGRCGLSPCNRWCRAVGVKAAGYAGNELCLCENLLAVLLLLQNKDYWRML